MLEDNELRRAIERLVSTEQPSEAGSVVDQVSRRRRRLHRTGAIKSTTLVAVVLVGILAGSTLLWRTFHPRQGQPASTSDAHIGLVTIFRECPEAPSAPGPQADLVVSDLDGNWGDLYPDMDMPGGRSTSAGERMPTWSPDGSEVAWVGQWDGGLYLTDASGRIKPLISAGDSGIPTLITGPRWSPTGETVAFASGTGIYRLDLGSGRVREFLQNQTSEYTDAWPTWSADGSRLAWVRTFHSEARHTSDVMVADAKSANVRTLFTLPRSQHGDHLDWSPDGDHFLFDGASSGSARDIYSISSDGRNLRQLTSDVSNDYDPEWSPDGKLIAFVSGRAAGGKGSAISEIYVMASDGSSVRRITDDCWDNAEPTWTTAAIPQMPSAFYVPEPPTPSPQPPTSACMEHAEAVVLSNLVEHRREIRRLGGSDAQSAVMRAEMVRSQVERELEALAGVRGAMEADNGWSIRCPEGGGLSIGEPTDDA